MTKTEAMELLDVTSQSELANALGITRSAVYQWPDELPHYAEGRVWTEVNRRLMDGPKERPVILAGHRFDKTDIGAVRKIAEESRKGKDLPEDCDL